MSFLRKRPIKFLLALLATTVIGEMAARSSGEDPAYVRSGRIRRSCGCRELRIAHAPPGMDTSIHYCINRLGLRGTLPDDTALRIITLGNSTTECAYIDDAATWPHLLACGLTSLGLDVWVGNAGVNGSSTRGNTIFLEDHLLGLHPDIVVFMPGAADRGRVGEKQDAGLMAPEELGFTGWMMEHSYLVGSVVRYVQSRRPERMDWNAFIARGAAPDTSRHRGASVPIAEHGHFVEEYRARIAHVADLCAAHNAQLVLLTQPLLAPDTSVSQQVMEKYNDATRALAQQRALPLFDLSRSLVQKPVYYVDNIHFSNAGAKEVARLLEPFIAEQVRALPAN